MNRKRRRKKPVGKSGFLWLDPKNRGAKYNSIRYGRTKSEIEDYILKVALASALKQGLNLYDLFETPPRHNAEDDFDFTLDTRRGKEYLDLMEVAPLERTPGSYAGAPRSYNNGEMTDVIWNEVSRKSERYSTRQPQQIHLLLYSTDWRFKLSSEVLGLVALEAAQGHVFASIAYYLPVDQESGAIELLCPRSGSLADGFDEVEARTWNSANLNLS